MNAWGGRKVLRMLRGGQNGLPGLANARVGRDRVTYVWLTVMGSARVSLNGSVAEGSRGPAGEKGGVVAGPVVEGQVDISAGVRENLKRYSIFYDCTRRQMFCSHFVGRAGLAVFPTVAGRRAMIPYWQARACGAPDNGRAGTSQVDRVQVHNH